MNIRLSYFFPAMESPLSTMKKTPLSQNWAFPTEYPNNVDIN